MKADLFAQRKLQNLTLMQMFLLGLLAGVVFRTGYSFRIFRPGLKENGSPGWLRWDALFFVTVNCFGYFSKPGFLLAFVCRLCCFCTSYLCVTAPVAAVVLSVQGCAGEYLRAGSYDAASSSSAWQKLTGLLLPTSQLECGSERLSVLHPLKSSARFFSQQGCIK